MSFIFILVSGEGTFLWSLDTLLLQIDIEGAAIYPESLKECQ
jgi:hypothetical protein